MTGYISIFKITSLILVLFFFSCTPESGKERTSKGVPNAYQIVDEADSPESGSTEEGTDEPVWVNGVYLACNTAPLAAGEAEVACAFIDADGNKLDSVPEGQLSQMSIEDSDGTIYSFDMNMGKNEFSVRLPMAKLKTAKVSYQVVDAITSVETKKVVVIEEAVSTAEDNDIVLISGSRPIHLLGNLGVRFDPSRINLERGGGKKSVDILLSEPAPQDAEVKIQVYGNGDTLLNQITQVPNDKTYLIAKGSSRLKIDFELPAAIPHTEAAYIGLVIAAGEKHAVLDLGIYTSSERKFSILSSGSSHTCGLRSGELFCWGNNESGQLGDGVKGTKSDEPKRIGIDNTWIQVAAGFQHTCGILATNFGDASGELFCWGNNLSGQLGDGSQDEALQPQKVGLSNSWQHIVVGTEHSCGINAGHLYCWGGDSEGQLGRNKATPILTTPEKIGLSDKWTRIAAGSYHSCGVDDGKLYCWGKNDKSQIGGSGVSHVPRALMPELSNWTYLATGFAHSCGIESGKLYCWGFNQFGQAGIGNLNASVANPTAVGTATGWTQVSAGSFHSCGLESGKMNCWGWGLEGQLGIFGNSATVTSPQRFGSSELWSQVSLGSYHSCGVQSGSFYCWGRNFDGQLGNKVATSDTANIELVSKLQNWSKLAAGDSHSCGISQGALFCWGKNHAGQLGIGEQSSDAKAPLLVGRSSSWTHIAAGYRHSCGIAEGRLFCWGDDGNGQVGNGPGSLPVASPEQIGSSVQWSAIALGEKHSCGIDNGQLYCWGSDQYGQVGDGVSLSSDKQTPARIGIRSNWTQISVGKEHSCGIAGGELYCWGRDHTGQVGNGNLTSNPVTEPVKIGLLSSWSFITSGDVHSCGIESMKLYCWGNGVGDEPILVDGTMAWSKLSIGRDHFCGTNGNGLYCWGDNAFGQLGNGNASEIPVASPSQIEGETWSEIVAGSQHTCGIKQGFLYCWGSRKFGEIANQFSNSAPGSN